MKQKSKYQEQLEKAKDLHKGDLVDIKLLTPDGKMFLVEIKHRH